MKLCLLATFAGLPLATLAAPPATPVFDNLHPPSLVERCGAPTLRPGDGGLCRTDVHRSQPNLVERCKFQTFRPGRPGSSQTEKRYPPPIPVERDGAAILKPGDPGYCHTKNHLPPSNLVKYDRRLEGFIQARIRQNIISNPFNISTIDHLRLGFLDNRDDQPSLAVFGPDHAVKVMADIRCATLRINEAHSVKIPRLYLRYPRPSEPHRSGTVAITYDGFFPSNLTLLENVYSPHDFVVENTDSGFLLSMYDYEGDGDENGSIEDGYNADVGSDIRVKVTNPWRNWQSAYPLLTLLWSVLWAAASSCPNPIYDWTPPESKAKLCTLTASQFQLYFKTKASAEITPGPIPQALGRKCADVDLYLVATSCDEKSDEKNLVKRDSHLEGYIQARNRPVSDTNPYPNPGIDGLYLRALDNDLAGLGETTATALRVTVNIDRTTFESGRAHSVKIPSLYLHYPGPRQSGGVAINRINAPDLTIFDNVFSQNEFRLEKKFSGSLLSVNDDGDKDPWKAWTICKTQNSHYPFEERYQLSFNTEASLRGSFAQNFFPTTCAEVDLTFTPI
ncbi:hypothetical protein K432DRAFT_404731 [Lepidopterella palustris CBS 459.81]|uniref:Uncharacterized protein n=1 Tax=Lepidopterella palustris CBS 459.81 TaxID=1314670 RepID=A0A8E2EAX2_9PEZI|nr:hypothetical protein K432DRAFT_404731 [Lepidopterella palustris CBS 459.81]